MDLDFPLRTIQRIRRKMRKQRSIEPRMRMDGSFPDRKSHQN